MIYVDGFLSAVPTLSKEAYRRHFETVAAVFKDYGALSVVACWRDEVPEGALTSMRHAVRCQDHETVCLFG